MRFFTLFLFIFLLIFIPIHSEQNDLQCIVPKIPDSHIVVIEDDIYSKLIIPLEMSDDKKVIKNSKKLFGKVKRSFFGKKEMNSKQVYDYYLKYFKENDFKILLKGGIDVIGRDFFDLYYDFNPWRYNKNYGYTIPFESGNSDKSFYICAKKIIGQKEIYATIFIISGWNKYPIYRVDTIDTDVKIPKIIESNDKNNTIGILPESKMSKEEISNFSQYKLIYNPEIDKKKFKDVKIIEGKLSKYMYYNKKNSSFGIYKSYLEFFNKNKYDIICSFEGNDLNNDFNEYFYEANPWDNDRNYGDSYPILNGNSKASHYILAKKSSEEKDIYISVFSISGFGQSSVYRIDIIETEANIPDIISTNAIDRSIEEKGRIELYGILFKTGSANIMDISKQTLKILADYIKSHDEQNYYLVGHTDNRGELNMNMELSKNRANAVKEFLIKEHNINPDKITCYGVGPLYPVSTNNNEDGRKYNRRVELVVK